MPVSLSKVGKYPTDPNGAAAVWPDLYKQNFQDIETAINTAESTVNSLTTTVSGKAAASHTHDASTIGTGTKDNTTYFRGDGQFSALPVGTSAVAGIVRLATDAEAATGTATDRAVTPANLNSRIAALIAAAPGALDTLDELAAALGDDPNFAASVTTLLAEKASKFSDETWTGVKTFSAPPAVPDVAKGTADSKAANTKFVAAEVAMSQVAWHTRTGGVVTGAIDVNGTYPPRPIDGRQYVFTNSNVQPSTNGNRITGGGGMDVVNYPYDYWIGF